MIEAIRTLRMLVLSQWDRLQWRHHGIGVLQAYLFEDCDPEVRLHVWHPRLTREGIMESGDCHDHRFNLRSTVLAGQINETFFGTEVPDPNGAWQLWQVQNARAAGHNKQCGIEPLPGRYSFDVRQFHYIAGVTYAHPRGTFHRTWVEDLAITLCLLGDKRGQARLLTPYGKEPVHAFGEPAPEALQNMVLAQAHNELRRTT
jgi:hypothetical protein